MATRFEEKLRGKAPSPSHAQASPSSQSAWNGAGSSGHSARGLPLLPQAIASELQAQQALLGDVEQNLQAAKRCSSLLASRFQEHCPDLERQEAEVHKLDQRFNNLCLQAEFR